MAMGLAGALFGALAFGLFLEQREQGNLVDDWPAFVFVMGFPLLLAVLAIRIDVSALRALSAGYAVICLVFMSSWALGSVQTREAFGEVWITSVVAIPAVAAIVWAAEDRTRGLFAWAYLIVIAAASGVVTFATSLSPDRQVESAQTALYSFAFSAVFVAVAQVAIQGSARLDQQRENAAIERERALLEAARADERHRIESLVHDGAISTLLMAGQSSFASQDLAEQARQTLQDLSKQSTDAPVPWHVFRERVVRISQWLVPHVQLSLPENLDVTLTGAIADAFEGAISEALRNYLRHATGSVPPDAANGQDVPPVEVCVEYLEPVHELSIQVRDGGIGFDLATVDERRLGIRRSIIERMELAGGAAHVKATPGVGTRVTMTWRHA